MQELADVIKRTITTLAGCYTRVRTRPSGYQVDISMTARPARATIPQPPILLRETRGSISVLTLNRPEARNSLSEGLIAELHAALREIHDDARVRAVVIAANGPAFSAGHDIKELTARRTDADRGRAYFAEIMNACSAMMQAIVHLPKPVVAAVQGVATAAGCQLVASCDLAVASEAATFATPGVDIGLFCSTPMVALSRNVPRKQAMEMLLTGEPISARAALGEIFKSKIARPYIDRRRPDHRDRLHAV